MPFLNLPKPSPSSAHTDPSAVRRLHFYPQQLQGQGDEECSFTDKWLDRDMPLSSRILLSGYFGYFTILFT